MVRFKDLPMGARFVDDHQVDKGIFDCLEKVDDYNAKYCGVDSEGNPPNDLVTVAFDKYYTVYPVIEWED